MNAVLTDLIMQYLRIEFGRAPAIDEPLLGAGLLDSLRFVLFITYLEEQLSAQIPEEDLTEDNFRDVRAAVTYLSTLPAASRFAAAAAKP